MRLKSTLQSVHEVANLETIFLFVLVFTTSLSDLLFEGAPWHHRMRSSSEPTNEKKLPKEFLE